MDNLDHLIPNQILNLIKLKRFDFEAKLQRMSVVVKNMGDRTFRAYVKGSPEKIAELCISESLPLNYYDVL
jgi:magnesium-transporting ATPase (P-type)